MNDRRITRIKSYQLMLHLIERSVEVGTGTRKHRLQLAALCRRTSSRIVVVSNKNSRHMLDLSMISRHASTDNVASLTYHAFHFVLQLIQQP